MSVKMVAAKIQKQISDKALNNKQVGKSESGKNQFKDVLTQMDQTATDFADKTGLGADADLSSTSKMQAIDAEGIMFDPAKDSTNVSKSKGSDTVLNMLSDVNQGQYQMDSIMNHILYSGKKFSNQELLVIQAKVFQFAQETEMAVKIASESVSSVKTLLNTQVQ